MPGLLARLSPRIVDSICAVRLSAIQAIWLSFKLSFLHKGQTSRIEEEAGDELFDLDEFRENHLGFDGKLDSIKGRTAISAISEQIEKYLPQSQLQTYISALFKMLNDKQNNVSSASAQLLSVILKDRGQLLHEEAEILVQTILDNLPIVHPYIQTYTDLLNALTFFADHQLYNVVEVLLKQPIPHSNSIEDAWKMMVHQQGKFSYVADQILEGTQCTQLDGENKVNTNNHFEVIDLSGGCIVKIVNQNLCGNMAALMEIIKSGEPEEDIKKRISKFIFVIFHNLIAVIDTQYPNAVSQATPDGKKKKEVIVTPELKRNYATPAALIAETLRALLERMRADNVIEIMNTERAWSHLVQPDYYISAVSLLL